MSESLIFAHFPFLWAMWVNLSFRSNQMSDVSKLLMVAHFWWAKLAIHSHRSFDLSDHEGFAQVAQRKWAMWANHSFLDKTRAIRSEIK